MSHKFGAIKFIKRKGGGETNTEKHFAVIHAHRQSACSLVMVFFLFWSLVPLVALPRSIGTQHMYNFVMFHLL
jgi:hypothetical protein